MSDQVVRDTSFVNGQNGKVIAEYNMVSGVNINWQKNYVFMGNRLLATESTTQVLQFHHPDSLGSRLVTSARNGTSVGETGKHAISVQELVATIPLHVV